jgi:hypothetical protein
MSLSGKHIDISYIIERVYRDYGFDLEIKYDEVIEWVWDVMSLIGTPQVMVDKITDGTSTSYKGNTMPDPIVITDYRGELPNDLYSITLARDYESKMPMVCKSSSFVRDNDNLIYLRESQYSYTINGSYIYPSFETGYVELHYKAFPTSATGMPLVPDDIKFVMATQSYIAERIAFRLWLQDKLTERKYEKFNQERNWYIGAAQTKSHIPSLDEMEAIKNRFLRLKINPNFHDASFLYANDKERLILHNNSGK